MHPAKAGVLVTGLIMSVILFVTVVTLCSLAPSSAAPCNASTSLGGSTKLTFCREVVDIRVFQGERPTREGINLKTDQWETLLKLNCHRQWKDPFIFKCDTPQPIGENIKLTNCNGFIDIRKYAGKPTIVGVVLRQSEWKALLKTQCK